MASVGHPQVGPPPLGYFSAENENLQVSTSRITPT